MHAHDDAIRRGWATEEPIAVTADRLGISATSVAWRRIELGLSDGHEFHGALLAPLSSDLMAM